MVPLELRVIYGDTDRMGVVYYANYLRYFEAGRSEYIRHKGPSYLEIEQRGFRLPVIEARVRYLAPAGYDDLIVVETTVAEVRRASLRFTYRVLKKGAPSPLCEGETVHACINEAGKPTRLPKDLVELLQPAAAA